MATDLILGESSRSWSRDVSGVDPWPLVWTPSTVRAEIARARNLLDLANREVLQAVSEGKLSGAEKTSWDETYKQGRQFTDKASAWWSGNVAPARQYAAEADRWRALVKERGGKSAAPKDAGRPRPDEGKISATQVVLLGIGGATAIALLVSAVKR